MRYSFKIILFFLCLVSCGQRKNQAASRTLDDLHEEFVNVILDSSSTWPQVIKLSNEFVDSLIVLAADETHLNRRLAGQKWGFLMIDVLREKQKELLDLNQETDSSDILPILDKIHVLTNHWFYEASPDFPHLWCDLFYVSNQSEENPSEEYFHISVTCSSAKYPDTAMVIFYPESGKDSPALIFRDYLDNGQEDVKDQEMIPLVEWGAKDDMEKGSPMYAKAGYDVVEKMLSHDVMYLLFMSGKSPESNMGGFEMARLSLAPFKAKWKECSTENRDKKTR